MAYTTLETVRLAWSEADETTDYNGDGKADSTLVAWAIGRAETDINKSAKIGGYDVPFSTVPEEITALATDRTIMYLLQRANKTSDTAKSYKEDTDSELLNLEAGKYKFEAETFVSIKFVQTDKTLDDQVFSDDNLAMYE